MQPGITPNCDDFYFVQPNDSCYDISGDQGITLSDFCEWNPAVNDCSGLQVEVYVCVSVAVGITTTSGSIPSTSTGGSVSTPIPIQEGMVKGCKEFYIVQTGDGCWATANDSGIDLDGFYEWNPAVKSDCSVLQANVYVCIGI